MPIEALTRDGVGSVVTQDDKDQSQAGDSLWSVRPRSRRAPMSRRTERPESLLTVFGLAKQSQSAPRRDDNDARWQPPGNGC